MALPLRNEFPGAAYHVTAHGSRRKPIERMQGLQWRHDHELALAGERIAQLQAELVFVCAQNRDLRQRVFDSKTVQSRNIAFVTSFLLAWIQGLSKGSGFRGQGQVTGRRDIPIVPASSHRCQPLSDSSA